MKRVGLFGGSFDPVHYGHVLSSVLLYEMGIIDVIVVLPTNSNPLKNHTPLFNLEDRLLMCKIAFQNMPYVSVLDLNYNYTIDMLKKIKNLPSVDDSDPFEYYLIVGSDIDSTILQWKDIGSYKDYIKNFIVLCRDGNYNNSNISTILNKPPILIDGITIGDLELSSTNIRRRLKSDGCEIMRTFVPSDVCYYIKNIKDKEN